MTKALEARDRLRARIEAVLRKKGGFEVAPYLEAIAIEQWLYGDPNFMAALIEENDLSADAAIFVSEIVRGTVRPVAEKSSFGVHPGAALFAVVWLMAHRGLKRTVAVDRAALDLKATSGHVWELLQEFDQDDVAKAVSAVASATEQDFDNVVRNAGRPPVFAGTIWTSSRAGL